MGRLSGQAARGVAYMCHLLAHLVMGTVVVTGVLLVMVAWRLSQGPLELPWATQWLETAINDASAPTVVSIGSTALAWEGFSQGVDRPLDLRIMNVHVTTANGRRQLDLPRADISLSVGALLQRHLEPRAVAVEGARFTLLRAPDGSTSADLGSLGEVTGTSPAPAVDGRSDTGSQPNAADPGTGQMRLDHLLQEFAQPATDDRVHTRGLLSQLRRVRIANASIDIVDRQLGAIWRVPHATMDIVRRVGGGLDGSAMLDLALGTQTATLDLSMRLDAATNRVHLDARTTQIAPAALARAAPRLSPLSALDAPLRVDASLDLTPSLVPEAGRLTVRVGEGSAMVGSSRVAIRSATFALDGSANAVTLRTGRVVVVGHPGGDPTVLGVTGTLVPHAGRYDADIGLTLDQVAFADLGQLWPSAIAPGARAWVVENVPAGVGRNARVTAALSTDAAFSDVVLRTISGKLDGDGLTVHWLRPVPPIEDGTAQLRIVDPDTIDIAVASGRQKVGTRAALALRNGLVRITRLSKQDQFLAVRGDASGSVPDVIALLKEPRLGLLDKHPVELRDPAGTAAISLKINLPLAEQVQASDVTVRALAHVTGLHLGGLVAGRDIDQGIVDLDATAEAMTVKGQAQIAGIAFQVDGSIDFGTGPPNQVIQRMTVTGRPGAGQLAAAGIDLGGTVLGQIPVKAVYAQRRMGDAEVALDADLTPVTLAMPPIGWRKPIGVPAHASGTVLIHRDKLVGIDRILINGDAINVHGSIGAANGQIVSARIDNSVFGRNQLHGTVSLVPGQPIQATLAGPSIDLSPRLTAKSAARDPTTPEPSTGPAWAVDARFDRVFLAGGLTATGIVARVENDGKLTRVLRVTGQTGDAAPFTADLAPQAGGRRLSITAADAGVVLQGLDIVRTMRSGSLTIRGTYDDTIASHPLTGAAEIEQFRVQEAEGLAKLLQAMTLYGLVDVMRGPGIGFSRLIAPFRFEDEVLTLNNARAFSSSLGLTAKGRLDLAAERIDVEGTIVPAYFFNSLLGNLPIVGKLFSPEQGGGVFSARYSLRGKLADPSVSLNPLSALTPGFLREIFGLF